ncbi:MAG: hypothetical protein LiPW39_280 [Parcubacteria group bacterium LiPW_39]|nr:MAG: hypothetical protein LiPW39_280 [Parcubacteria group bacterium LiPW_39]
MEALIFWGVAGSFGALALLLLGYFFFRKEDWLLLRGVLYAVVGLLTIATGITALLIMDLFGWSHWIKMIIRKVF